jgi:hypothetical protein
MSIWVGFWNDEYFHRLSFFFFLKIAMLVMMNESGLNMDLDE